MPARYIFCQLELAEGQDHKPVVQAFRELAIRYYSGGALVEFAVDPLDEVKDDEELNESHDTRDADGYWFPPSSGATND